MKIGRKRSGKKMKKKDHGDEGEGAEEDREGQEEKRKTKNEKKGEDDLREQGKLLFFVTSVSMFK
jgi:hypothetical protein